MSVQMIDAKEGKEFTTTYIGRFLKEKFRREPKYRKRVPRRWISEGYVIEQEIEDGDGDCD